MDGYGVYQVLDQFPSKGGTRSITRWQHLLNRVHPTCTERPSLNKECGWKGGDRSGLAQGQEFTGRKEKNKNILTRKKEKTYLTLTGLLMEGLENCFYHDAHAYLT